MQIIKMNTQQLLYTTETTWYTYTGTATRCIWTKSELDNRKV